MKPKIIQQGAEAIISLNENNQIIKNRIKKSYRLPILEKKIRKRRTKSESKILNKLKSIINVPKIIETKGDEIIMEYIKGKKLSETLDNLENKNKIAEQIGKEIAKLHDFNIIHGDLTTSNMIYVGKNSSNSKKSISSKKQSFEDENIKDKQEITDNDNFKVYFIDFGLGFHSKRIEDKAVDLHLIKQALEAKHFNHWKSLFDSIIKGYTSKDKTKILEQLKKVESRGRYKKH